MTAYFLDRGAWRRCLLWGATLVVMATPVAAMEWVTVEYSFAPDDVRMRLQGGYAMFDLVGEPLAERPGGTPALPAKPVNILIPDGTRVAGIKVRAEEAIFQRNVTPYPSQPPVPLSQPSPAEFVPPDPAVYKAATPFPDRHVVPGSVQQMRGHSFVSLELNPLRYHPADGIVMLATGLTVSVQIEAAEAKAAEALQPAETATSRALFSDIVKRMVSNPEALDSKDAAATREAVLAEGGAVDYLVITDAARSNAFRHLADYRAAYNGFSTRVITVEHIDSTYSGADTQERIRTCIQDYVQNNALTYVVLGGDNTIVPDRDCYVRCGDYTESSMPTDLYYSGLDGSWDEDGDGTFGEASFDGSSSEGDLAFDVIVGRIPVRTSAECLAYTHKLIGFESTNRPSAHFYEKMMVMGYKLWDTYTGVDRPSDECDDGHPEFQDHDPVSDADIWQRRMVRDRVTPHWQARTEYAVFTDTVTSWDGASAGDYALNDTHAIARFNEGWHLVNMFTHGNWNLWSLESGYFYPSDAAALQNLSAIVYTEACITGKFDGSGDPCLSEAFLRNGDGGAVIYLGCSRYGWGSPGSTYGGTSCEYAMDFYDQLFDVRETCVGRAFAEHKAANISLSGANGSYRWIQFGLNLQGDPALTLSFDVPMINIAAPQQGDEVKVDEAVLIQADTVDGYSAVTSVSFFVEGAPLGTSASEPYEVSWTPESVGPVECSAVAALADGGAITSDPVRIQVVTNYSPEASVTAPADDAIVYEGQDVDISASVQDADGSVTEVRFLGDGVLLGTDAASPYEWMWPAPAIGEHSVAAVAVDNTGKVGTSAVVRFTVVEDGFTEQFDVDSPFDVEDSCLTLIPTADGSFSACLGPITTLPQDPSTGVDVSLGDDDSAEISWSGTPFEFFGQSYTSLFINSNGSLTFDEGDTDYSESLSDHFSQPRISLFFDDLNPSSAGSVSYEVQSDRVVVTYDAVPQYSRTAGNTAQVELFYDGAIRMSWLEVNLLDAVVGVSEGTGTPAVFEQSDLSAYGGCTPPAVVVSTNRVLVPEGGSTNFLLRLSAPPLTRVEVTVACTNGDPDIACDCGTVPAFTAATYDQWQSVPLSAAEDDDADDGECRLGCSGPGLIPASVLAVEVDNDSPEPDTDGDGMPDTWEEQHFHNATNALPEADADGDGTCNYDEWLNGCDPTNSASIFRAESVPVQSTENVLRWPSVSGRVYAVYCATNLVDGFRPLATNLPAAPPANTYTDSTHAAEARVYYRVNVQLAE